MRAVHSHSHSVKATAESGPDPERVAEVFRTALVLADQYVGATAPNPPVGCVLLAADGTELARAAHPRAGEAHAEAIAIAACMRDDLVERIHTAVVTLEPCSHAGRTPPCVDALLKTPVRDVWIGTLDPHPRAPGQGLARLTDAGVRAGLIASLPHPSAAALAAASAALMAPFSKWARTGRPWVLVKTALDTGGGMIPPPGRTTFTSTASLRHAHRLRRRCEAIITGSGCVIADAPAFTVRHVADHPGVRRRLVILDRRGRVPQAYLEAARGSGLEVSLHVDPGEALDDLGASGVLSVLLEAGPTLRRTFLNAGLWDEEIIFHAALAAEDRLELRGAPGVARFMDTV